MLLLAPVRVTQADTPFDQHIPDGGVSHTILLGDPVEGVAGLVEANGLSYLLISEALTADGYSTLVQNLQDGAFGELVIFDKLRRWDACFVLSNDPIPLN